MDMITKILVVLKSFVAVCRQFPSLKNIIRIPNLNTTMAYVNYGDKEYKLDDDGASLHTTDEILT